MRAIEGGSSWFFENAATFSENAEGRWASVPGIASVQGDAIRLQSNDNYENAELVYTPPALSATTKTIVVSNEVTFLSVGYQDASLETDDTALALTPLADSETGDEYVFAVIDTIDGVKQWRVTDVQGYLGTNYVLTTTFRYTTTLNLADLIIRKAGESESVTIATVTLPSTAEPLSRIAYSGSGEIRTLSAETSEDAVVLYDHWSYANAILTWEGSGATTIAVNTKYAVFRPLVKTDGTWEDSILTYTGNVKYTSFPGYDGGALAFYKAFAHTQKGYAAPGMALRFKPNPGAIAPIVGGLGSTWPFTIGGLIVEAGATGYSMQESSSTPGSKRETYLGDTSGTQTGWFAVNENFSILRAGKSGGNITFYGDCKLDIATGKALALNTNNTAWVTRLDEETNASLTFYGDGTLAVYKLVATGDVTLDYSHVDLARTQPVITGDLTIDDSTHLSLPESFELGATLALCSGSVEGLSTGVRTVTIGGVESEVLLELLSDGHTIRRAVGRATISADKKWSGINWDAGFEWIPGADVELTFTADAQLTFDTPGLVLPKLTVGGSGAATFAFSTTPPELTSLTIPEGFTVTLVGGASESAALTWATSVNIHGRLITKGYLNLTGSANTTAVPSVLEVADGKLLFARCDAVYGSVSVAEGATLTYQSSAASSAKVVPVALWDGDFSSTALTSGDFTLTPNGNTVSTDGKSITLGSASGVLVDGVLGQAATVLVKYESLNLTSSSRQVLATIAAESMPDREGVSISANNTETKALFTDTSLHNPWTGGTAEAEFPMPASSGVYAFTVNQTSGLRLFHQSVVGATPDKIFGNKHSSEIDYTGFTIGGLRSVTGQNASGMKVTGIAVFNRELTTAEITSFDWGTPVNRLPISVNFGSSAGSVASASDPAGALAFDRNWYNFSAASGSDERVGTSLISWSSDKTASHTGKTADIQKGYLNDSGSGVSIVLSSLPTQSTYDLLVYRSAEGAAAWHPIVVNGTSYSWTGSATAEGSQTWGADDDEIAYGQNVLRVRGLRGPELTITSPADATVGGVRTRGTISAIQLVAANESASEQSGVYELDVQGTLNLGDVRLAIDSRGQLTFSGAASCLASGGALEFSADAADGSSIVVKSGTAQVSVPLCMRSSAAFDIAAEALLRLNGGFYDATRRAGFVKTGLGTLSFGASASTSFTSPVLVSAGTLTVPSSLGFSGPLTVADGASLAGSGTISGALTLKSGAVLVASTSPFVSTGSFTQEGAIRVDCGSLASSVKKTTVLTVADASTLSGAKAISTTGGWFVSQSDASLLAKQMSDSRWGYAPIVTWRTTGSVGGTFDLSGASVWNVYDPASEEDTTVSYKGNENYLSFLLYTGTTSAPFWTTFSDSMTAYVAPGTVIRLRSYQSGDLLGTITSEFSPFSLAGLFVESGATSGGTAYSIVSTGASAERVTHLGDPRVSGGSATWFVIGENFTINRASSDATKSSDVTLFGKVNFEISSGKTFDLNSAATKSTVTLDVPTAAQLAFRGTGTLKVPTMIATNRVTLDFSNLTHPLTHPPITGALKIDGDTQFRLPDGLEEGADFQLCTGTLTATGADGVRLITVGSGDEHYARLTFTAAAGTVKYTTLAENTATVSGNTAWDDINWNNGAGWRDNGVAIITLTDDAAIGTWDVVKKPAVIIIRGPHGVMLSGGSEFDGIEVVLEEDAYYKQFPFYWVGGSSGSWESGSCWNLKSRPCAGAETYFTNTATVTASKTVKGSIHIRGANMLNLTMSAAGDFQGIQGGTFTKRGAGTLTVSNSVQGVAVDGTTINLEGGKIVFAASEADPVLKNAHIKLTSGTSFTESNNGIALVGTLTLENVAQVRILSTSANAQGFYGEADIIKKGAGRLILDGLIGGVSGSWNGALTIEEGILEFARSDETSHIDGVISGNGSLAISSGASVAFATADTWCAGGLSGSGNAAFTAPPTADALATTLPNESVWKGTIGLLGVDFGATPFDPNALGNASSTLRFSGCSGFFSSTVTAVLPKFEMLNGDYTYALRLTDGHQGLHIVLSSFSGDGSFIVCGASSSEAHPRYFIPDLSSFTGSLAVEAGSSGNCNAALVVLSDGGTNYSDPEDAQDGQLVLWQGDIELGTASTWSAVNGICIRNGAALTDSGTLASRVCGSGLVRYSGTLASDRPEEATQFGDAAWCGTVFFDTATLSGVTLSRCGNSNSRVRFRASSGSFTPAADATFACELIDGESGEPALIVVPGDAAGKTNVVGSLCGSGTLATEAGAAKKKDAFWHFSGLANYTGVISNATDSGVSFVFGDREPSGLRSSLDFAYGIVLDQDVIGKWISPRVDFENRSGEGFFTIKNGGLDTPLLRLTADDPGTFSHVSAKIDPDPSGHSGRVYGVKFDGDTQTLRLYLRATRPSATISDVQVVYGADLTNSTVRVKVADFIEGYGYEGIVANVVVRDGNGTIVGAQGVPVDREGLIDLGCIELVNGRGGSFSYEITLVTQETAFSNVETLDTYSCHKSITIPSTGSWISENVSTFQKLEPGTGTWNYNPEEAKVEEDQVLGRDVIRVSSDDISGAGVHFAASRPSSGDTSEIELLISFNGSDDIDSIDAGEKSKAALTIANDGEDGTSLAFAGWNPSKFVGSGGFEKLYGPAGAERPEPAGWYRLKVSINKLAGTVSYCLDGVALTNAQGLSSFALRESQKAAAQLQNARFHGRLGLDCLEGTEYTANLAKVNDTEYATVDEAVSVAIESGEPVKLLWDATWHPAASQLGKDIVFDGGTEGYQVNVDAATTNALAAQGYCVRSTGAAQGYAVDVLSYAVVFSNLVDQTSYEQPYTVTNRVFNLKANEFEREGFDFLNWNLRSDGYGASWTNRAEIDVTPYGLRNIPLYAQWTTAVRTITVEPADEYVYIEQVTTNSAVHTGVRYYEATPERHYQAKIPVLNGCDIVVYFSTDLEKKLTFNQLNKDARVFENSTIPYEKLPKIWLEGMNVLTPIQVWAAAKGISLSALASSDFSQASYRLNTSSLLEPKSVVKITEFTSDPQGCSFKVTIDGEPLSDPLKIAEMIRVSNDLSAGDAGWVIPPAANVTADAEGRVHVATDSSGSFIKIVIPKND